MPRYNFETGGHEQSISYALLHSMRKHIWHTIKLFMRHVLMCSLEVFRSQNDDVRHIHSNISIHSSVCLGFLTVKIAQSLQFDLKCERTSKHFHQREIWYWSITNVAISRRSTCVYISFAVL